MASKGDTRSLGYSSYQGDGMIITPDASPLEGPRCMCMLQKGLLDNQSSYDLLGVAKLPLTVQVPDNHILTQNLYYNYHYPKPTGTWTLRVCFMYMSLAGRCRSATPKGPRTQIITVPLMGF